MPWSHHDSDGAGADLDPAREWWRSSGVASDAVCELMVEYMMNHEFSSFTGAIASCTHLPASAPEALST